MEKKTKGKCWNCGEELTGKIGIHKIAVQINEDVSLCSGCNCMTKSIRKGRAHYVCGKCGHDKSLGDFLQKSKDLRTY